MEVDSVVVQLPMEDIPDEDMTELPSKRMRSLSPEIEMLPAPTIFTHQNVPSSIRDATLEEQHAVMIQRELQKPRKYNAQASYVTHRRILVDWVAEVGELHSLHQVTIHTAVHYLDSLLSYFYVPRDRLQLVAIGCLLIASKVEEKESHVPSVSHLNYCADYAYTDRKMVHMEMEILTKLGWNACSQTAVHFQGFYLPGAVVEHTDKVNGHAVDDAERLARYVQKYAEFFLDMTLQEHEFVRYKASALAVASIAAARRTLRVEPDYPPALEYLSTYAREDIAGLLEHMWGVYNRDFPRPGERKPATSPNNVTDFPAPDGPA